MATDPNCNIVWIKNSNAPPPPSPELKSASVQYKRDTKENYDNFVVEQKSELVPRRVFKNAVKRPGRPRKKTVVKKVQKKCGVSECPGLGSSHIELLYDNPIIFKRISQFFKSMAADRIQIKFRQDSVVFWTTDHHRKNKILITLTCSKLNFYYCKSDLEIGISFRNLDLVFSKIDKSYHCICLLVKENFLDKNIEIRLTNDMSIDEQHKIDMIGGYPRLEDEGIFARDGYKLNFRMPVKYFKKMIVDVKSFSNVLSICKYEPKDSMRFEYITKDKKIKSSNVVRDPDKIKLEHSLTDSESFRVSFAVEDFKPISCSMIANEIMVHLSEDKPMLSTIVADEGAFIVRVLTEIIDERKISILNI